ncbi:sodium:solute symporter family transporter [Fictibacillus sp. WQ 8-8]
MLCYLTVFPSPITATANLPVLLFSFYWNRLTTLGATWGIIGGLIVADM